MENWWGGEPTIAESWSGSTCFYSLKIFTSQSMIKDTNRSNIGFCRDFVLSKVEDEEIITKVEELSKM